ncbi:hypothetical protein [Brevundimonas sp. NIBR11]|uniref:hypothetical protein n=1 Tax=Brevundimonas sp. NIBR11 TaxID=3015999 RepID=UPI0022F0F092|nr:hypothetical protein [Brevundimonas sp. NIBR11]WGM31508.1 hypothetical protein KKHFBJBL_01755 [Brevundimonas sp. NIBR11]
MTKAPTAEERRTARQAELAEQARRAAEQAIDDADMNLPVLKAAMKDVEALAKLVEKLKAHSADLLPSNNGVATWQLSVETLAQVQGNLQTIGEALVTHCNTVLDAPAA